MKATPIRHFLIALLLLLSQQLAVVHPISHFGGAAESSASQDGHGPGTLSCDQCLALSPLGSALGTSHPPTPFLHFEHVRNLADMVAFFLPLAHRPFDGRAPPSR